LNIDPDQDPALRCFGEQQQTALVWHNKSEQGKRLASEREEETKNRQCHRSHMLLACGLLHLRPSVTCKVSVTVDLLLIGAGRSLALAIDALFGRPNKKEIFSWPLQCYRHVTSYIKESHVFQEHHSKI
jgi:hypothetical protein